MVVDKTARVDIVLKLVISYNIYEITPIYWTENVTMKRGFLL